ncbi:MAG TPA: DUF4234 domain-containing protein [Candidatus Dorea gallistercoris]|uniref:DUF4234 domain-containing protein n=1 Tax=Candidatus Dorea gallistercoris TaxID=2838542 RepID=A0A9D1R8D7_9FIRM|nr:DUF4234 domain-containing protein [Candidatus Dorea gallistercoris]
MKYCTKCGAVCPDNAQFCPECGSTLPEGAPQGGPNNMNGGSTNNSGQYSYGNGQNYQSQSNNYGGPNYQNQGIQPNFGITPRSIPLAIIFSIITCGIYGLYWLVKLNDEVNQLSGEYQATSGGMVLVFTIITCGIYGWYWLYKMGERCDRIKGMNGSSGILYLVLGIFGLSIISYCLIQDTINKTVER